MPTFTIVREAPKVLPVKKVIITLSPEDISEILEVYRGASFKPYSSILCKILDTLREL